jgi:hypothetical protein
MTMGRRRIGTIVVPPGAVLDAHEKKAVDFIAIERGANVTFLIPNRQKGRKTPDIEMNGLLWEIKSPKGKSPRTIENNLRLAILQSTYIILDLRRLDGRVPTRKHLAEIDRQFKLAKSIRHIIVITREEAAVDFKR